MNFLTRWLYDAPESAQKSTRYSGETSAPVWIVLVALLIPVALFLPAFFEPANLANATIQMVPLALIAIGQTVVILGGGIDLSVGSLVSLITVVSARLMTESTVSIVWAVSIALAVGLVGGLVNGLILKYFSIPPLIVTLAVGYIYQGIALAFNQTSGGTINSTFSEVMTFKIFGFLPVPILILIITFFATLYLLNRTRYGRWVYALGGDEEVLESAGANPNRVRIGTYVICGLLCAVAALYLAARLKSGNAHYGDEYMLLSIAAVVVGGASLAGGKGTLLGTLAGVVLVSIFNNLLNILGFEFNLQSAFYKGIVVGGILLIAMLSYGRANHAKNG